MAMPGSCLLGNVSLWIGDACPEQLNGLWCVCVTCLPSQPQGAASAQRKPSTPCWKEEWGASWPQTGQSSHVGWNASSLCDSKQTASCHPAFFSPLQRRDRISLTESFRGWWEAVSVTRPAGSRARRWSTSAPPAPSAAARGLEPNWFHLQIQLRVRSSSALWVWQIPSAASCTWALSPELSGPWRPPSTALPPPGGSMHKTKRAQGQTNRGSHGEGVPTPGLASPPSTWAFRGGRSLPTRVGTVPAPGCLSAPGLASRLSLQVAGTTRFLVAWHGLERLRRTARGGDTSQASCWCLTPGDVGKQQMSRGKVKPRDEAGRPLPFPPGPFAGRLAAQHVHHSQPGGHVKHRPHPVPTLLRFFWGRFGPQSNE